MLKSTLSATLIAALASFPVAAQTVNVNVGDDPVLYWSFLLSTGLPGSPVPASRGSAMVGVALHDAVNATLGSPDKPYLNVNTVGGDTRAAASVAAHDVLVKLNPGGAAAFDAALAASLALVPNGAAKSNGIATGQTIAAAVLSARANDGSSAVVPYTPSGLPGRWAPTPGGPPTPVATQWPYVTPWLLQSGDQVRAGPPPALDSAAYTAAFLEVKEIGSATSFTRTADQTASAQYWNLASGAGPWIQAGILAAQADGASTLRNAQAIARLTVGIADTTIALFDTKYTYDYWRPITGIRGADGDGNPLTDQDVNWSPLIATPPHPSYISAHSAFAGVASSILEDAYGNQFGFCLTWAANNRCWNNFSDAAEDATNSRLWGGIHWRFDNEGGLQLGQQVGRYVLDQKTFGAVPEPASWALMIGGFGLVGAALRRRRDRVWHSA